MAQPQQVQAKVEIQSSPEKFYNFLKYKTTEAATAIPHIVKKAELIEGQEGQAGNVHLFVHITDAWAKAKATVVDDDKKTIIYVVVEGEILKHYARFEATVTIEKKHVVWTFNYEKASPLVPDPDTKLAVEVTKALDAYILVH